MRKNKSQEKFRPVEIIGFLVVVIIVLYLISTVYNLAENFFFQFSWGKADLCEMSLMSGAEAQEIGDSDAINEILTDRFEMRDKLNCPVFIPSDRAKNMSTLVAILFFWIAFYLTYKVVSKFQPKN